MLIFKFLYFHPYGILKSHVWLKCDVLLKCLNRKNCLLMNCMVVSLHLLFCYFSNYFSSFSYNEWKWNKWSGNELSFFLLDLL